jgi:golgi phosphoprotein 3
MLTLPEELMLLALSDDDGKVVPSSSTALPYGLAGAVVMELALLGKMELGKEALTVSNTEPTGNDILDAALGSVGRSSKDRPAKWWICRPDTLVPGLKDRLLARLVEGGVLKKEEHHFLWLIPYNRYPTQDSAPEMSVREQLRGVVVDGEAPSERTAVLLCLVHACSLVKEIFPDLDAKAVAKQVKEFAEGDQVAAAVSEQVSAITMMIVTSVISSTVMMSTINASR